MAVDAHVWSRGGPKWIGRPPGMAAPEPRVTDPTRPFDSSSWVLAIMALQPRRSLVPLVPSPSISGETRLQDCHRWTNLQ